MLVFNSPESGLAIVAQRIETIHSDITEMKSALRDLTAAITKLALIEERQANFASAQERGFKLLADIEKRVEVLELERPTNQRVSQWVDRALWAVAAAFVMLILNLAGVHLPF